MTPVQRIVILSTLLSPLLAAAGAAPRIKRVAPAVAIAVAKAPGPTKLLLSATVRRRIQMSNVVDPPAAHRTDNWLGSRGQGSCMWASAMNLLRWQGRGDLASWIAQHRGDGASFKDLADVLDQARCEWAYGDDERFLEWACRTRRGAIVEWDGGGHVLNLVGLDRQWAFLLDNTGQLGQQIVRYRRAEFVAHWKQSGGHALTPLAGVPTPPKPWIITSEDKS
jgi:hypothetical protein